MKKVTIYSNGAAPVEFNDPKKAAWITDGNISIYDILDKENISYQYPSSNIICVKTKISES